MISCTLKYEGRGLARICCSLQQIGQCGSSKMWYNVLPIIAENTFNLEKKQEDGSKVLFHRYLRK